jgi:serine/threonine protein phosphatase PrpC
LPALRPLLALPNKGLPGAAEALAAGFEHFDARLSTDPCLEAERCGSTVACAIVQRDHILVANLGDSRTLLASAGEVAFHSTDHVPR